MRDVLHETMMKKLFTIAVLIVGCLGAVCAHDCPHPWNQVLREPTVLTNTTVLTIAAALNQAVCASSSNRVRRAVLLDLTPPQISRIHETPATSDAMDELIDRYTAYAKEMQRRGGTGFETCKVRGSSFRPPIACCLCMVVLTQAGMGYEETESGAVVSRSPQYLECRSYPLSDRFVEMTEGDLGRVTTELEIRAIIGYLHNLSVSDPAFPKREWKAKARSAFLRYLHDQKALLVLAEPHRHTSIRKGLIRHGFLLESTITQEEKREAEQPGAGDSERAADDPFAAPDP